MDSEAEENLIRDFERIIEEQAQKIRFLLLRIGQKKDPDMITQEFMMRTLNKQDFREF